MSGPFVSGLTLYNGTLELSSTLNTVLPTLRRTAPPAFVAHSRHWRGADVYPAAGVGGGADDAPANSAVAAAATNVAAPVDATLKEFINTSIAKNSSVGSAPRRASAASIDDASVTSLDDPPDVYSVGRKSVSSNRSQGSDADGAEYKCKPMSTGRSFGDRSPAAVLVLPRSTTMTEPSHSYISHSPSMLSIHSVSSLSAPTAGGGSDFDFSRELWKMSLDDRDLNSRASTTLIDDVAAACSRTDQDPGGRLTAAVPKTVVPPAVSHLVPEIRQPFVQRHSHYLGELVWQVDDVVFCGGIEAAHNENLLCRLNISIIIDLSSQYDDPELKNRPRNECPCLCSRRTAHSRTTMYVNVRDRSADMMRDAPSSIFSHSADSKKMEKEREMIIDTFRQIVKLTQEARIKQQRVLIHSLKCRNRAPAFVAAYLMKCTPCTRVQALMRISNLMSKTRPGMCISDGLQRALMRWQTILGIRQEVRQGQSDGKAKVSAVKRNGWS